MTLLLDMDGVIVDYFSGVCRRFKQPTYPYSYTPGVWSWFAEIGMTDSDVAPCMDREFYASLDWMPDGREIVEYAERKAGPDNVYLLTAPWDTDGCLAGKMDWVKRHMPRYTRRVLMGTPKELCSRPDAVLLDDSESNCRKFVDVPNPGTAVVCPRPWNVRHPESCLQTGRVLDLEGLFHGYRDGRPHGLDDYLAKLKAESTG